MWLLLSREVSHPHRSSSGRPDGLLRGGKGADALRSRLTDTTTRLSKGKLTMGMAFVERLAQRVGARPSTAWCHVLLALTLLLNSARARLASYFFC